jgi:hypothetical protein
MPHDEPVQRSLLRLRQLAWLMDSQFLIPGTTMRVGLDGLIGLIPGIGDFAGALISLYIIHQASRLGATRWMIARMLFNVLLEALIGLIPLLGDLFDIAFKANIRNLKLIGIDVNSPAAAPARKRV